MCFRGMYFFKEPEKHELLDGDDDFSDTENMSLNFDDADSESSTGRIRRLNDGIAHLDDFYDDMNFLSPKKTIPIKVEVKDEEEEIEKCCCCCKYKIKVSAKK